MAVQIERTGMLLIISGPSGTGKGTLVKKLMDSDPTFRFSCSVTTRKPREGEIEGVHYHFVSDEEYERLVQNGEFLEHATVHGHHYGTLRKPVEEMMAQGYHVLLDIDPQGAISVMENAREYVSVFILPPSFEDLRIRLHTRNTDDPVEIERRLRNARGEVKKIERYQYAVINDNLELAFSQLQAIVSAEKQRTTRFKPTISEN
ncbi:MAG: guanylate kinase [Clostridiales bacterium]|nr:guanylate kinase [Clostridiales bacterium]MDO4349088.1 guanylate kinase [Eubacteriales bacterium]MDY4009572.1 guanylate kinase [Candidatus Limiplasma sp.]